MASYKLSELTAVTSTADESLIYVADTQDSGTSYSGRKITKSQLFNGFATESYVTTAISNLIDGAPVALDTLNELAAALNDDASAASTLTALINANETHIDNLATLTGVAKDETDLGTFSGVTIADDKTIKEALQALETAVESKGSAASLTSLTTAVGDLNTLSEWLRMLKILVHSRVRRSRITRRLRQLSRVLRLLLKILAQLIALLLMLGTM